MTESVIIKLEVGRLKQTIQVAMSQYTEDLTDIVQKGVDKYCTVENLTALIDKEVKSVINITVKEEIHRFYRYGEGSKVVKEAIRARLGDDGG